MIAITAGEFGPPYSAAQERNADIGEDIGEHETSDACRGAEHFPAVLTQSEYGPIVIPYAARHQPEALK